jgi:ribosomal protein S18 acetylase RimI-like enzyme
MRGPPAGLQPVVIVRDARPQEAARIGELRVAAYTADGFLSASSAYAGTLRALGAGGAAAGDILVAVEDGTILGTVMLQCWPAASEVVRGPGEAEIRALAVDAAARRRGIGRALVAAVTQRAADHGVHLLLLLTMPAMRAAQRLYAEAGFSRLPARDTSPAPGVDLLAFGRNLR